MSAAHHCYHSGMTEADAIRFIAERITRQPKPANEIETAVAKAYRQTNAVRGTPGQYAKATRPPVPLGKIQYDEAKLRAVAEKIESPASWRHWLWERSPIIPDSQNAVSFLARLYRPGEKVHTFDVFETKHPRWTFSITNPMDCRLPDQMREGGQFQAGVWYLCNPVDGQWHPNPRQNSEPSCRSEESLTAFRYVVLESDIAPADLWLAFIVQVPARIFGNIGTYLAFRVSEADAATLERQFGGTFKSAKFTEFENFELCARLLNRQPFLARSFPPLDTHRQRRRVVVRHSRRKYCTRRKIVEDRIDRWLRKRH